MPTRKEVSNRRKRLVQLLVARGIKPTTAHSELGFMLNRASVDLVESTVLSVLLEADPVSAAIAKLGEVCHA